MKKKYLALLIGGSFITPIINAEEAAVNKDDEMEDVPTIVVEGEKISEVSVKQVKSADLAEALNRESASISLVRRSGIANDVILRGQKKDNINILIDDAKIHGACANRMDPPTSHVITNIVDEVEIIEGPYDVENFGTLSGKIKVTTRKPEEGFHGDVNLNLGGWNYQKLSGGLSGGNESIQVMVSASAESSEQYEDGDGNTFAEQQQAYAPGSMAIYKPEFEDMDAYDKKAFMGKLYWNVTDNQEMMFSYTANRSEDVLYPNTPMDALYDDSDLLNFDYKISDLGAWSKALEVKAYNSYVDHPMSTLYRKMSGPNGVNEKINHLESEITGVRIKNAFDVSDTLEMTVGVDTSKRNWDGEYTGKGMHADATGVKSIDDVDTENLGFFVEAEQDFDNLNLKIGARYDDTTITPGKSNQQFGENDYTAFSGFLFGSYQLNDANRLFGGVGQASRVPDGKELYFKGTKPGKVVLIGTPDLEQTTNSEIDFGIESDYESFDVKLKLFYSWLDDFIVYNDSKMMNRYENVDATIYGLDLSGSVNFTDAMYLDYGVAWQRGEKDQPLEGQTGTNLPEIPPLKGTVAFNWDYTEESTARVEVVASDDWSRIDEENGEQELDSWAVMNLRVQHGFGNGFGITAGVDNLFDETYAVSNTYKDLTLVFDGSGEVMLMNEPGRYLYVNGSYRF